MKGLFLITGLLNDLPEFFQGIINLSQRYSAVI